MKNRIINWFINTWNKNFFYSCEYKYLEPYGKSVLIDYIEEKARELADKEDIKIISVLFADINKDEPIEGNKAVGLFRYLKEESLVEYQRIIKDFKNSNPTTTILDTNIYPRIEISELGNVFVILHELGHYFLYKRNIKQSEAGADLYIEEFFDNYLPPFLKWIYQIDINVRCDKKLKYTPLESYTHWKEYCKWKNKDI